MKTKLILITIFLFSLCSVSLGLGTSSSSFKSSNSRPPSQKETIAMMKYKAGQPLTDAEYKLLANQKSSNSRARSSNTFGSSSFRSNSNSIQSSTLQGPSTKEKIAMMKFNSGEPLTDAEYKLLAKRKQAEARHGNVKESVSSSTSGYSRSASERNSIQQRRAQEARDKELKEANEKTQKELSDLKRSLMFGNGVNSL